MSPGRRGGHRGARGTARTSGRSAQSRQRRREAARDRGHRRGNLHRLHEVHPSLSGRRDRRRVQNDAYGTCGGVYGLRALHSALPRGLHRHGAGTYRGRSAALSPALRRAPGAPRARGSRTHGGPRGSQGRARHGERRCRARRDRACPRAQGGRPRMNAAKREYATPFQLLIAVMLSAQATDVGVNKATRRLYPVAGTPQAILALGEEKLKTYISTIGLFNAKAKNVIATCRILVEQYGGEVPRTREALEALPGV